MPVAGATISSYNQNSFWAYPWGKSVTHKGVDIFAKEGTAVLSSTGGWWSMPVKMRWEGMS